MKKRATMLVAVAALVIAACGGGSNDTDDATGGPATTMAGMAGMSGTDHGGTAPCLPSGPTVSVVASGTRFAADCLAAPADQAFTINYDNRDSIGHNLVILESHTSTSVLFRADIFPGPKTSSFQVPALKAGTYVFHCEVHPSLMLGTFVVR